MDNLTVNYPGKKEVSDGHGQGKGCKPFSFWALWLFGGLLRNLYTGQEATVRTGHGTTDWIQTGKGVCQGCILSPCLFDLYGEYIMRNARLMSYKLESRLPGEISITSDMKMILL